MLLAVAVKLATPWELLARTTRFTLGPSDKQEQRFRRRMKSRANGDWDVFPRENRKGRIISYRGAYVSLDGKRCYVSGKTKEEARKALQEARTNTDAGLVFDAGKLTVGEYPHGRQASQVRARASRAREHKHHARHLLPRD
jgi:hypothetical protein